MKSALLLRLYLLGIFQEHDRTSCSDKSRAGTNSFGISRCCRCSALNYLDYPHGEPDESVPVDVKLAIEKFDGFKELFKKLKYENDNDYRDTYKSMETAPRDGSLIKALFENNSDYPEEMVVSFTGTKKWPWIRQGNNHAYPEARIIGWKYITDK